MTNISQLFLYLPGIVIFFAGSGRVRQWLRMRRSDSLANAEVLSCKHVVKKDKKDRIQYDYYDVLVEFRNPKTKHIERLAIKSATEYAVGQSLKMFKQKGTNQMVLAEYEDEAAFHPIVTMIGGALMIVLALEQNQGNQMQAMLCLTLLMAGAGANLLVDYIMYKRRKLQTVDAEVIDVFKRQISKETKIIKGEKFTYYPVVRYTLNDKENIRRCFMNADKESSFKIGEKINLYYDAAAHTIYEKKKKAGTAVAGSILMVIGIFLSVLYLIELL